jgi:hypothetical protein
MGFIDTVLIILELAVMLFIIYVFITEVLKPNK